MANRLSHLAAILSVILVFMSCGSNENTNEKAEQYRENKAHVLSQLLTGLEADTSWKERLRNADSIHARNIDRILTEKNIVAAGRMEYMNTIPGTQRYLIEANILETIGDGLPGYSKLNLTVTCSSGATSSLLETGSDDSDRAAKANMDVTLGEDNLAISARIDTVKVRSGLLSPTYEGYGECLNVKHIPVPDE